uniref:Ion transport domain-containing protein n=2 Tax=Ditylum brightwellii TaxID=49249 RepID=A0A7S4W3X5_9STRA|mmetsp:Transcript_29071/g.43931  ORF Transcript_29071/g.43931 Transcript_29071/m.43931 type:complete len:287 (-) Transcript_29071:549-1409(-)
MLCFRLLFGNVEGTCQLILDNGDSIIQECGKKPYGTLHDSLFSTFELAILASYDQGHFDESDYTTLAVLIFVLAVTIVLVIALNALIAVLGDSYSRVQEHAIANRRKERAELIVEYLSIIPSNKSREIEANTKYFHALLEADADGDLLIVKDDWEGGLNALKKDLSEQNATSYEMTRDAIEQLRCHLDDDMEQLKNDITSLIQELSHEIKEIKRLQNDGGVTFNNKNVRNAVKVVKGVGKHLDMRHHLEMGLRPFRQNSQPSTDSNDQRPFWQGFPKIPKGDQDDT